jgi:hypothetical protein
MRVLPCAERATLIAALCFGIAALDSAAPVAKDSAAKDIAAKAGVSTLDPAFRLPAGGLALAGPIIDPSTSPAAAWLLSEDLSLYALTENGTLAARIGLPERPVSSIALDPFGRVVVVLGGDKLSAYTRMGAQAWQAPIEPVAGVASVYPPAFGSDGRAFALSGKKLICLNPAGLRLWSLSLPAAPSSPPAVDGSGRPCLGLADGRLLIATPYGETVANVPLGAVPALLYPVIPSPGGGKEPCLAVGLSDDRVLLVGADGGILSSYTARALPLSFVWDGAILYGLDASGEAFAVSGGGEALWAIQTGCSKGRLYLFSERLVAVGQGRAVSLSLSGETFRELGIPGASGTPAVSPMGLAFSSGSDWVLAAYRFERPLGQPRRAEPRPYPVLPDTASKVLAFDPYAADPDDQLGRLADIEKSLRSGTIGKDEVDAAAYCAAVAERSLDRDLSQEERRRGGNPLPRSRACYLLGSLGSPAYREPLFRAIESDIDPAVRASACEALALLGVDPDGSSMSAFLAAAARPVDERTAAVIVAAIEGMALRSGQAPSGDGLRALVKLAARPYGPAVRDRAAAALWRISGASR